MGLSQRKGPVNGCRVVRWRECRETNGRQRGGCGGKDLASDQRGNFDMPDTRTGRGQVARIYGCHDAVTMGRAGIRGDGVV